MIAPSQKMRICVFFELVWRGVESAKRSLQILSSMQESFHQNEDFEHLDFLLNSSAISDVVPCCERSDMSLSKALPSDKQRTREQTYEDIMQQIHNTKLQQQMLRKQLEQTKREITETHLARFHLEFQELNHENQQLRKEVAQNKRRTLDERSERYSNRSSFKVRTTTNSVYGDQNREMKSARNQNSSNTLIKRKEQKMTESTSNLGRSAVHSPHRTHKRRESQLTERKLDENTSGGVSIGGYIEDCHIKQSVSNNCLKYEAEQPKNVLVELLEQMLREEKMQQKERYCELEEELTQGKMKEAATEVRFINEIEGEISETNQKLQMLTLIMNKYQAEIGGININLKEIEQLTERLLQAKGKYIQMEDKCKKLTTLRKQVQTGQAKLAQAKQSGPSQQKQMPLLETLLRIFNSNPKLVYPATSQLYHRYHCDLQSTFRFGHPEQTRHYSKQLKIHELISSIRSSRQKFNELLGIYEARIGKLQGRIGQLRR